MRVLVNSSRRLQIIDGWGECFNERGWKAMEILSPNARDALTNEPFYAWDGLKLNLCRTPIGASDYAVDLDSLNETAGDHAMRHFSIDLDRKLLIPHIKEGGTGNPAGFETLASPWSPP